jgi:iron complex outermembrane receptor protein
MSLLAIGSPTLFAQTTSTTTESSNAKQALEEIVVTARRREESLQDVPETVDAVSSDTVQKLNILKFEDIQGVVPGLTLGSNNNPAVGSNASMRGVSFDGQTGTTAAVEFYLNDAPLESNAMFQSMFDIGQIEVLRGPQGTLRGRASPSGAITITTRKADLRNFDAYGMASGTDRDAYNLQGALNLPIISEMLAVRFSGLYDDSKYDGIRSVNSSLGPKSVSKAGRVSISFQPIDAVEANLMYEHLQRNLRTFTPVTGAGAAAQIGAPVLDPTSPIGVRFPYPFSPTVAANYSGPPLTAEDHRSVQDGPSITTQKFDLLDASIAWRFAGQRLIYVGAYRKEDTLAFLADDAGNVLPGYESHAITNAPNVTQTTHELRLASEERMLGLFDYTVGLFYSKFRSKLQAIQPGAYLSGVFGSPFAAPVVGPPDLRYLTNVVIDLNQALEEKSIFGSVTWHITDATEFTAGGRFIDSKLSSPVGFTTSPALIALPPQAINPALTACPPGVGTTYPGTCDLPIPSQLAGGGDDQEHNKPFVYNVQLSQHFTDARMAYLDVGSSWRHGQNAGLGIRNAAGDPTLAQLTIVPPEKSRSYELGWKSTFLNNRARVNIAVYHQDFKGLIFLSPNPISYIASLPNPQGGLAFAPSAFTFTDSADAVVDGVDLNAAFLITPRWNASLAASYANGHVADDSIPCNDPTRPLTPTNPINLCKSNATVSAAPPWNATLQSEYSMPIMSTMDAYLRGLYTFYARNSKQQDYQAGSYGLLNLYLGIRATDGTWDVTAFAKNATNTNRALQVDKVMNVLVQDQGLLQYFPQPGYTSVRVTPWREFGLQVRYSIGAR